MSTTRPDFNEYAVWSAANQPRGNAKVDLFLLHTEEGNSNADRLARYLGNVANGVSYHYTISEDAQDHGVTVCDVVDTDRASWSVLSANGRSINLCFAGSRASWTRAQWLDRGRAIDVAAFIAVQDCRKYGIPPTIIAPPYTAARAGISDHNYVTKVLKDGTHTDVGPNFPWDVFGAAVAKYAGQSAPPAPEQPANLDKEIWDQLRLRWNMLGGQTLVEAVAEIRDAVLGTDDRGKTGVL